MSENKNASSEDSQVKSLPAPNKQAPAKDSAKDDKWKSGQKE